MVLRSAAHPGSSSLGEITRGTSSPPPVSPIGVDGPIAGRTWCRPRPLCTGGSSTSHRGDAAQTLVHRCCATRRSKNDVAYATKIGRVRVTHPSTKSVLAEAEALAPSPGHLCAGNAKKSTSPAAGRMSRRAGRAGCCGSRASRRFTAREHGLGHQQPHRRFSRASARRPFPGWCARATRSTPAPTGLRPCSRSARSKAPNRALSCAPTSDPPATLTAANAAASARAHSPRTAPPQLTRQRRAHLRQRAVQRRPRPPLRRERPQIGGAVETFLCDQPSWRRRRGALAAHGEAATASARLCAPRREPARRRLSTPARRRRPRRKSRRRHHRARRVRGFFGIFISFIARALRVRPRNALRSGRTRRHPSSSARATAASRAWVFPVSHLAKIGARAERRAVTLLRRRHALRARPHAGDHALRAPRRRLRARRQALAAARPAHSPRSSTRAPPASRAPARIRAAGAACGSPSLVIVLSDPVDRAVRRSSCNAARPCAARAGLRVAARVSARRWRTPRTKAGRQGARRFVRARQSCATNAPGHAAASPPAPAGGGRRHRGRRGGHRTGEVVPEAVLLGRERATDRVHRRRSAQITAAARQSVVPVSPPSALRRCWPRSSGARSRSGPRAGVGAVRADGQG